MKIKDFELEVFFGKYEFSAPHLLSQSDCQSLKIEEILKLEEGAQDKFLNMNLSYTEVPGDEALRSEISNLYQDIDKNQVIVHSGAQEPIFNGLNVLLDKGDHVICQFPVYQSLYEVGKAIGCQVDYWKINQTSSGWSMDFKELKALIKAETKVICINHPNNPTGFIFTESEMNELVEIARANNIYLLCDEVYKGLELDGIPRPWFADLYEKAISIGVLSKAYGLPGLRIGWTVCRDESVNDKLIKMKHYTTICNSGPSEFLATIALKHGNKLLERNKKIIQENMFIAKRFFEKYKDLFTINQPIAGPIAFHKINIEETIEEFVDHAVNEAGVLLLGSNVYQYQDKYIRFGYGRADFATHLQVFDDYLTRYRKS